MKPIGLFIGALSFTVSGIDLYNDREPADIIQYTDVEDGLGDR